MTTDTLRTHVNETLITIKQTFDDRTVSRAQVAYWYIIVGNQLLSQQIGKRDSGQFLTIFDEIPLLQANTSVPGEVVKNRKYIELPGLIFDFDKDGGVEYLSYVSDGGPQCPPRFARTPFMRTSPAEAEWLYLNPYTKPSPKMPYWYRSGGLIYTLGLENVPVPKIEAGIYMTIDPVEKIDIDKPFPFPSELLHVLKRQVVDLARFDYFFPSSTTRNNTGDDASDNTKAQIPKIISVNEQQPQQ